MRWCFFSRFEINFGVTLYDMTRYMYITITSKPFTTVINWDTSMIMYNVLYPVPFFHLNYDSVQIKFEPILKQFVPHNPHFGSFHIPPYPLTLAPQNMVVRHTPGPGQTACVFDWTAHKSCYSPSRRSTPRAGNLRDNIPQYTSPVLQVAGMDPLHNSALA